MCGFSSIHFQKIFFLRSIDAALLRMEVVALEQRDLGGPQPVMIGEMKQRPIALAVDNAEQPTRLLLG